MKFKHITSCPVLCGHKEKLITIIYITVFYVFEDLSNLLNAKQRQFFSHVAYLFDCSPLECPVYVFLEVQQPIMAQYFT